MTLDGDTAAAADEKDTTCKDEEMNVSWTGDDAEEVDAAADAAVPVDDSYHMKALKRLQTFSNPLGDSFPLFTRPIQRQRWGDTQIHPVVNWGDLFFDLFYVGAAYNLSYIIVYSPTNEGLLYFLGAFFPIMNLWMDKTFYDGRYFTRDDLLHRGFEILNLCALATAIVHIRPVNILSRPSEHVDMFGLSLGLLCSSVFTVCRYIEVLICVDGGPEAKISARKEMIGRIAPFTLYLAATIISGTEYFGNSDSSSYAKTEDYGNHTDDDHRVLADAPSREKSGDTTDVPIWLLLGGSLSWLAFYFVLVILCLPGGGKHKKVTVPTNISFVIHRYGEWVMLMLGESILSLLIVDVLDATAEYYLTFYAGILSVVLLQYLHFRSQPHHPDEHALRRSKEQGIIFSILMAIYSAALVLVGTAYKMLVNEHAFAVDDGRRFLYSLPRGDGSGVSYSEDGTSVLYALSRMLAGGDDSGFSKEERQQRIANLFCVSMAVVWLCSDLLMIVHKGLKGNVGRCKCEVTHKTKTIGIALVMIHIGLIIFIATLRGYVTDPTTLALIGLAGIVTQVGLRVVGNRVFPNDQVHSLESEAHEAHAPHDPEERKWPNVTRASVVETKEKPNIRASCPPVVQHSSREVTSVSEESS